MRAITILQPWASAIALGHKCIETRGWRTAYRGPLAIHAGANQTGVTGARRYKFGSDADTLNRLGFAAMREMGYPQHQAYELAVICGCIIAVCELVDCCDIGTDYAGNPCLLGSDHGTNETSISAKERALGDYTPGRYGWVLANVRALPQPIPCSGKQGLWTPPVDVLAQLEVTQCP